MSLCLEGVRERETGRDLGGMLMGVRLRRHSGEGIRSASRVSVEVKRSRELSIVLSVYVLIGERCLASVSKSTWLQRRRGRKALYRTG